MTEGKKLEWKEEQREIMLSKGERDSKGWEVHNCVLHSVLFYLAILLLHLQSVCTEKGSHCQSDTFQMVLHSGSTSDATVQF